MLVDVSPENFSPHLKPSFPPLLRALCLALIFSSLTCAAETVPYRGWKEALRIANGQVEVVVVPEIGRVMSFRFLEGENVLWEDASLAGQRGDPSGKTWVNFGGDKTWPSPEAEWGQHTGHPQWMPPAGFDGTPATARFDGELTIVLTSSVDTAYGIRAVRRISLAPDKPEMSIETTYERLSGKPAKIGIWVISQFRDPIAVYVPLASPSLFSDGYFIFRDLPWKQISKSRGLVKLTRDPAANHKLGADTDRLLWIGEKTMCLVASARVAGGEYPDRGASAEVYTNSNPKNYVEIELLGPLSEVKAGDKISRTSTYTLFRRAGNAPDVDARQVLR